MTVDALGRAIAVYRRTATSRSAVLLIAANLIPLVGVLVFGWSLWTILVVYWVENGIVGLWNIPKMLLAQGATMRVVPPIPDRARVGGTAGRAGLAVFFCIHYGIFWFVHGVFVFMLPLFLGGFGTIGGGGENGLGCDVPPGLPSGAALDPSCTGAFGTIAWDNVILAAIVLFLSHGASFLFNYIGRGEYLTATAIGQMAAPYGRVVILHLTILFGAFVVAFLGAPIGALLLLVVLKTAFDLGLHLRERRSADARVPIDTAYGQIVRGPAAGPPA